MPVEAPSPQRIRQLTAAIRKTWSPQVRASRAVQGRKPVETKGKPLSEVIIEERR